MSQWKGLYTVIDRVSEVNYKVKLVGSSVKPFIVHHNWLKSCYGTPSVSTVPLYTQHLSTLMSDAPLWLQLEVTHPLIVTLDCNEDVDPRSVMVII